MNLAKRKRQFPSKSKAITVRGALSAQELRFVDELLLDLDPEAAAYRAGLRPAERGRVLIDKPAVRGAVQLALQRRSIRSEAQSDEVLRRWWVLATADARELAHVRRVNCRHCYGIDHRYQFTQDELRRAQQDHEILQRKLPEKQRRPFDDCGGDGYDGTREPA